MIKFLFLFGGIFIVISGFLVFSDKGEIIWGLPFSFGVVCLVIASMQQAKVLPEEKKSPPPKLVKKALKVQTLWGDHTTQEDTSDEEEIPQPFFYSAPYIYAVGGGGLSALWLLGMHFIPKAMLLITIIALAFAIIIFFTYGLPTFMLRQEKKRG